jgi:hypothetical protein
MTPDPVRDAFARARRFVDARGDEQARLRLAAALGDVSSDRLESALRWSGVRGTLAALAALDAARALHASEVERIARWLEAAQRDDGSWAIEPDAPEAQRIVATGLLAGFLAKTSCARPASLRSAGAFLATRWGPERVQGGDFGAIAGYAHFFANTPHELSDAGLQWCGRELERGFRSGRLAAWQAARVLALCDARALPGARLGADEIVLSLLAEQAADGGWLDAGAEAACRVAVTIDAAVALARLGGATPHR